MREGAARPRVVALIQARMGSTRLPGKVLRPLQGKSVLAHVIERVRACPLVETAVVATSDQPADERVVEEALRQGAEAFRGSEHDVLDRFYRAARQAQADWVVRVTADCPLLDPQVLTGLIGQFAERFAAGRPVDYMSTALPRTFPRGLDAEIFTRQALEAAHQEARQPFEREHVTPFLYQHPERFRLAGFVGPADRSAHRWTLDTPEDWELIAAIYDELGQEPLFTTETVLALLAARPELVALNAHVEQKPLGA